MDRDDDNAATGIIAAGIIAFAFGGVIITDWWVKRPCKNESGDLNCVQLIKRLPGDAILFEVPNVHPTLSQVSVLQEGVELPCPWFHEALSELKRADRVELTSLKPWREGVFLGNIRLGIKNKKSFKQVLLEHGCDGKIMKAQNPPDKESHDQPPSGLK
jgi:hypothetical protein